MILLFETLAGLLIFAAIGVLLCRTSEKNIAKMEKLCRNKVVGLALSLPCALLCVPLAVPVSPGFLQIWLWPLAIVLPLLCYFHIDYYASRGLAFMLILWAYDVVHGAFELKIPVAPAVTVIALLLGMSGIWLAAKPCLLRDIFRKAAVSKRWKYIMFALSVPGGLTSLYMLIMCAGDAVK
jgi:hypothetical protein